MPPTVRQIVPEQNRGSIPPTLVPVKNQNAGYIKLKITSPTFGTDSSLTWHLVALRSYDGGASFVPVDGFTHQPIPYIDINGSGGHAGNIGKGGIVEDGLPYQVVTFDGADCDLQVTVDCPTPFVWGLSMETV